MAVPDELPLDLGELDGLAVEFGGDPGRPLLVEALEGLAECDFLHAWIWLPVLKIRSATPSEAFRFSRF